MSDHLEEVRKFLKENAGPKDEDNVELFLTSKLPAFGMHTAYELMEMCKSEEEKKEHAIDIMGVFRRMFR